MINDLFRTYKKIILILLVILCSVVFWFYGCRHQERNQKEVVEWNKTTIKGTNGYCYKFTTTNCRGNVVFGVAGYVAKEKVMPVTLKIEGIDKSFTGIMKVTLPGENGKGIAYQSAVKCKAGESRKIVLNIPQLGNPSTICFEILDSFGVTQISENVSFSNKKQKKTSDSEKESLIGILSSQPEQMAYINNLEIGQQDLTGSVKIISFSAESFPEEEEQFQGLDGMIIDSFDTGRLSEKQISSLKKWMLKSGGRLLIAGGSQQEDSLRGIGKKFGITEKSVSVMNLNISSEDEESKEIALLMSNLEFSKKYSWTSYGTYPEMGYTTQVGTGKLMVLRFSLVNSTFLRWSEKDTVTSDILTYFLEGDGDTESSDTSLWYVKKALYAFMKSQLPNTFYYGVFFIFYILLIVMIAYYYLRKIKKREYIWIVVPMMAMFFSVVVIIRSKGITGGNDSSFSALKIVDSEKEQETVYFLYQSNEGEERSVNLLPLVNTVVPLDYNYRTSVGKNIKTSGEDFTINNTKKGFDIAFEESVPGSSRLLKLCSDINNVSSKKIFSQNIETTYTTFYGDITNVSSNNFSRVVLIRGNQYMILKDVKAGEKVNISAKNVKSWNRFNEENSAFGTENENTVTGNLMEYLQQTYLNTEKSDESLLVVGITNENNFKLFSDNNILKNHVTMMIDHFQLDTVQKDSNILNINTSCIGEKEEGLSIEEDTLDENKTEVTYQFDNREDIVALVRNRDSFHGKIYAYNYQTKKKEQILSSADECLYKENLENYLSENGEMIVTYKLENDSDYGAAPILSLIYKKQ